MKFLAVVFYMLFLLLAGCANENENSAPKLEVRKDPNGTLVSAPTKADVETPYTFAFGTRTVRKFSYDPTNSISVRDGVIK